MQIRLSYITIYAGFMKSKCNTKRQSKIHTTISSSKYYLGLKKLQNAQAIFQIQANSIISGNLAIIILSCSSKVGFLRGLNTCTKLWILKKPKEFTILLSMYLNLYIKPTLVFTNWYCILTNTLYYRKYSYEQIHLYLSI